MKYNGDKEEKVTEWDKELLSKAEAKKLRGLAASGVCERPNAAVSQKPLGTPRPPAAAVAGPRSSVAPPPCNPAGRHTKQRTQ